jgi:hypothetical protein
MMKGSVLKLPFFWRVLIFSTPFIYRNSLQGEGRCNLHWNTPLLRNYQITSFTCVGHTLSIVNGHLVEEKLQILGVNSHPTSNPYEHHLSLSNLICYKLLIKVGLPIYLPIYRYGTYSYRLPTYLIYLPEVLSLLVILMFSWNKIWQDLGLFFYFFPTSFLLDLLLL